MPENLKPLTALRFFAAMWVVAFHFWPALSAQPPAFVSKGYLGVELFFVLSGFILSHVYLQNFGEGRFRYTDFLWARLARIYPLHVATVLGMGLLIVGAALLGVRAGDKVLMWTSLPAQLTLTQAWGLGLDGGWNHPSWSISAEWFAYVTFPAFAALAWRWRSRPRLALGAAIVTVIVLETVFERVAGSPLTRATIAWGALRIVPCFTLGCAIFLLWRTAPVRLKGAALGAVAASLAAISAGVFLGAPDWMEIICFGALIFSLASLARAGSAILTAPAWVYLGEVSFAVYMVCIPWQLVFTKGAQRLAGAGDSHWPTALWLVEFLGVIPAAMVLHHLVERPAREAMRRSGSPLRGMRRPSSLPAT